MESRRRIPLQDLLLEQFLTPDAVKTPRKHKRPLSPSQTTPLNPAKRRVLDAEGITFSNNVVTSSPMSFMLPNLRAVTPTKPSRLGNGLIRSHTRSQGTSPLSSRQHSPSGETYPKPTIESSTDPQSRHYPGFDIFRDIQHRRDLPAPRAFLPSDSNSQSDRSEEDKENMPLRKKAKKLCSKKRLSSFDSLDPSCLVTPSQTSKVFQPERTPFPPRQTLR